MIKMQKTGRGYGPILICDICGDKLGRKCVAVYESNGDPLIDVRIICRTCDEKKGNADAWDEGKFFFDNLIHNTDLLLTDEDKEIMKDLAQL